MGIEIVDFPTKSGDFPVRYFDKTRGYQPLFWTLAKLLKKKARKQMSGISRSASDSDRRGSSGNRYE